MCAQRSRQHETHTPEAAGHLTRADAAPCDFERFPRILLPGGLGVLAGTLLSLPFIPFQDFPAHALVVELDRQVGESHALYEPAQPRIAGYSLAYVLTRFGLPFLSAEHALEVLVMLSALLLPLAAANIARSAGSHATWAAVFCLPLALSWPVKIGFIPYNLGMIPALFAVAAAVRLQRLVRTRDVLIYAACLLCAYLSHAVAFCVAGLGVLLTLLLGRSFRTTSLLAVAAAPALALFARDLFLDGFAPMPGTERTLPPAPLSFRELPEAFVSIFTRGFSMVDPTAAAAQAPLVALIIWGAAAIAAGFSAPPISKPMRRYLLSVGLALTVGTLIIPDSLGLALLIAARLPQVGWLFLSVAAAAWLARTNVTVKIAAAAAVALSLGSAATDLVREADSVSRVVGSDPRRELSGKFVTAVLSRCESRGRSSFGTYEPLRHVADMWLTSDAATPYVFAWNRYHPVWYRSDVYQRDLRGPVEWLTNADEVRLPSDGCAQFNVDRLRVAMSWPGFNGVVAAGPPGILEAAVSALDVTPKRSLGPGVLLLPSAEQRDGQPDLSRTRLRRRSE